MKHASRLPSPAASEAAHAPSGTLTVAEAAEAAGVSRQAIAKRIKSGDIARVSVIRDGRALAGVRLDELREMYPSAHGPLQPVAQPVEQPEQPRAQPVPPEVVDLRARLERTEVQLLDERERRARAEGRAEAAQAAAAESSRAVTLARRDAAEAERSLRSLALELGQARGRVAQLEVQPVEQPRQPHARAQWPLVVGASALGLALSVVAVRASVGEERATNGHRAAAQVADGLRTDLDTARAARATADRRALDEQARALQATQEAAEATQRADELGAMLRGARALGAARRGMERWSPVEAMVGAARELRR